MDQHQSQSSIRSVLWLIVFVAAMVGHTVLDVIRYSIGDSISNIVIALTNGIGALAIASLAIFFYDYSRDNHFTSREDYFREYKRLLFALFIVVLPFGSEGSPANVFSVIFDNILSIARIAATAFIASFVYRVLVYQRIRQTDNYIKVLMYGVAGIFVLALIPSIAPDFNPEVLIIIMSVMLFIIMFLATKRKSWIQTLTYKEKKSLTWMTCVGTLLGMTVCAFSLQSDTPLGNNLDSIVHGFNYVLGLNAMFAAVYSERMFWTTLFSLPNSGVVEKRTFEFSSVAYLNRIAAESTDLEKLYATVTQLAQQASRATSAWCEIQKPNGKFRIAAQYNITEKQILAINDGGVLRNISPTLHDPYLVELIAENKTLGFLARSVESFAKSLMIAPLHNGKDFVGAVYVVNSEPFSFENDDIRALAAFASSASVAIENARLVEDSLQKERYQRELVVGRQIQRKLLPACEPSFKGYEISAYSDPALEVGGDYYDYYTLANGTHCVLIADVSGKGISAAFYMANLKGVCLAVARQVHTVRELVEQINATLFGSMERQMYITLTAVQLNSNGTVTLVRAGHTPALLYGADTVHIIKPSGLGIGLAKPSFFTTCIEEKSIQLQQGETLLLFTDGVNEARNPNGDEIGVEELSELYKSCAQKDEATAGSIINDMVSSIHRFALHTMQHDDITMIAIRRNEVETLEHNGESVETMNQREE
ncbi:MAG: PP2C family protein-serine/threonine phosphatase [Bacteriodetes bacterium]|nr:PP2C family protein-serine/threonine phosphatase [Bacteroidota bacterium]